MNEVEIRLHEQRVKITSLEETLKVPFTQKITLSAPAETTLALRSLQLSRMWLGEGLTALGGASPYSESFKPENTVIEDQQDRGAVIVVSDEDGATEIQFLKFMRKEILELSKQVRSNLDLHSDRPLYQLCAVNGYTNIKQAQMWLGVALGVIHDKAAQASEASSELPVDDNEKELDPNTVPPVTPTGPTAPTPPVSDLDLSLGSSNDAGSPTPPVNPADNPPPLTAADEIPAPPPSETKDEVSETKTEPTA
jgi:hypothetical protein